VSAAEIQQLWTVLAESDNSGTGSIRLDADPAWTIVSIESVLTYDTKIRVELERDGEIVPVIFDLSDFEKTWDNEPWIAVSGRVFGVSMAMTEFATIHDIDEFVGFEQVRVRPGGLAEPA